MPAARSLPATSVRTTLIVSAEPPIAIDRVERAGRQGDNVRLRLSGRWLIEDPPGELDAPEALLVIQLQGRRHRFPADRAPEGAASLPGLWRAEFTVPAWSVPSRRGQAAVWVGTAVIAVEPPAALPAPAPVPEASARIPRAGSPIAGAGSPQLAVAAPGPEAGPASAGPASTVLDAGRGGPLADALLKETVSALHTELERRSAEAARLRGALADAQSELDARASRQASLESAHGELRHELEQLMAAATRQRQDLESRLAAAQDELPRTRDQLASAQISRDAAISEAGGLRTELERLGAELTVMREQMSADGGDLGEVQRLLADARMLTEQLRGASNPG